MVNLACDAYGTPILVVSDLAVHTKLVAKDPQDRTELVVNVHGDSVPVILSSPVLNEGELEYLLKDPLSKPQVLPTFFGIRKGIEGSLEKTLYKLCEAADEAVRNGSQLLVLSDRSDELDTTRPAIPILLDVGAVHQHLIQNGLRMKASIVADIAQCFSTHQFACLIGYGAREPKIWTHQSCSSIYRLCSNFSFVCSAASDSSWNIVKLVLARANCESMRNEEYQVYQVIA